MGNPCLLQSQKIQSKYMLSPTLSGLNHELKREGGRLYALRASSDKFTIIQRGLARYWPPIKKSTCLDKKLFDFDSSSFFVPAVALYFDDFAQILVSASGLYYWD